MFALSFLCCTVRTVVALHCCRNEEKWSYKYGDRITSMWIDTAFYFAPFYNVYKITHYKTITLKCAIPQLILGELGKASL